MYETRGTMYIRLITSTVFHLMLYYNEVLKIHKRGDSVF